MNYYNEIKTQLINNEVYKRVKDYSKNRSDLMTYYNVGKLLIEAQGGEQRAKYGDNLIKEYSIRLTRELNTNKYNCRNLMNMRKFYLLFRDENVNALRSQLTWTHYRILLSINDIDEIKYYIRCIESNNISTRELQGKIKSKEYERLPISTRNKLISKTTLEVQDLIKDPIIIKNTTNTESISEKALKQLILEDISSFLKELGNGFSYIDQEYKIKIGDTYNYIDLILFNYIYNCFVVVELKVTELKKEHIGQIQVYMNYVDKNLRTIHQDKTIGIIISKKNNQYIIEYCSDPRIYIREYILKV